MTLLDLALGGTPVYARSLHEEPSRSERPSRVTHRFRILDPARKDPSLAGRCAFTVMAKAPVAGRVKTRLTPPLAPEQAAELNKAFLRDTLANLGLAAAQCKADCVVSYTPVGQEAAFVGILPETTLLVPQRGDGFGERLLLTASDLFACGFGAVCLIDSDSPTVPTAEFVQAARLLRDQTTVMGRSDDGGYYLLGLCAPHAALFERISWSTELVAAQTAERAAEAGLALAELATWYDVDDARTLARLRAELANGGQGAGPGYPAPHTRACLSRL